LEPISKANPHVSAHVERAVEKALELLPKNRWGSVLAFKAALCSPPTEMVQVTRPSHEGKTQKTSFATIPLQEAALPRRVAVANEQPAERQKRSSLGPIIAAVILMAVVLAIPLLLFLNSGEKAFAWLTTQTVESQSQQVTSTLNLPQTAAAQHVTRTARVIQLEKTQTAAAIRTEASVAAVGRQQTEAAQATINAENTAIALTPTAYPSTILSRDMRMALIPAGDFQMGAEDGDIDQRPVHPVYIDAFYMDMYEVTNAQFVEFLNHPGELREDEFSWWISDPSYGFYSGIEKTNKVWQAKPAYERHPVTWVTWYGAQAYCAWRAARLPTEAEWEKAARGGLDGMKYPWGDEMPVCTRGATNGAQFDDCPTGTATIGYFGPNGYGLYDMAGNVMEWVADWYLRRIYLNFTPDNPTGPSFGEMRVTRGGAWTLNLNYLMVADRTPVDPKFTDNRLGFRCARNP
jgi:formylglycine-generating enzyme required for sulfatase activity